MSKKLPLMRKATAVWLVENTSLTFAQISKFCDLHEIEVQGIADGDVASGMIGQNPILNYQLTREEIARCEADPRSELKINEISASNILVTKKKTKYTPVARRQDKPDGIAFLLKYYPNITNLQIKKLIGTTDKMIDSIRDKSYWNYKNIKPRDIIILGLCSQSSFNQVLLEQTEQVDKEAKEEKGLAKKLSKKNSKAASENKKINKSKEELNSSKKVTKKVAIDKKSAEKSNTKADKKLPSTSKRTATNITSSKKSDKNTNASKKSTKLGNKSKAPKAAKKA